MLLLDMVVMRDEIVGGWLWQTVGVVDVPLHRVEVVHLPLLVLLDKALVSAHLMGVLSVKAFGNAIKKLRRDH